MGFANKVDQAEGRLVTVGKHPKNGKPVRFRVRTLTPREREEARRLAYGKLKGRQLGKEPAAKLYERALAETVECAIREVIDSENFDIGIVAADVPLYSKALGRELKPGEDVVLDGHWTEEVRRDVFENIDGLAKRVDDKVSRIELGEAEEEDEDTEAF